jgi:hypothetical protein
MCLLCNSLVKIDVNCRISGVICESVSSNLTKVHGISISGPIVRLIRTGNKFQNVKTMRGLYRMTLEMLAIDSKGQSAPIRVSLTSSRLKELLIGQVLRNTRACE